jgi:hypothetical protein
MNLSGGQNISQAGGSSGNILGQLLGGIVNSKQQKSKIEMQKQLMDYSHNLQLQRMEAQHQNSLTQTTWGHVARNMAEGLGSEANFNAESSNYSKLFGDDKGKRLHQEAVRTAGMQKGVPGQISLKLQSRNADEETGKGNTGAVNATEPEDMYSEGHGIGEIPDLGTDFNRTSNLNVGMGEGK